MGICSSVFDADARRCAQRSHHLREVFNGLRWLVRTGAQWRMMPNDFPPWPAVYQQAQPSAVIVDGRTMQSTPESGGRAGYDGYKRKNGSKIHMAVDTLGLLLALHVTPADEQERDQIGKLAEEVQAVCHKKICQGLLRRSRRLSCSRRPTMQASN